MQAVRNILVVMSPQQPDCLALKRARLIAGTTQSRLHLLACEQHGDHQPFIDSHVQTLIADGYSATGQQAWRNSLHETVNVIQQAEGCDLVIKQHMKSHPLKKALLTPEEWKLLRYCQGPVLITKTDKPWQGGVVLAAIDVGNGDAEHKALHSGLVGFGHAIAELANGTLHVISAHPSPMLSAADPTFQLSETIQARYRKACAVFQAEYAISDDRLHVEEGPADVLIPYMAGKLSAAVTVVGTVARGGLSGALIGNTAEVVLDQLDSDVLVLKPETLQGRLEDIVARR